MLAMSSPGKAPGRKTGCKQRGPPLYITRSDVVQQDVKVLLSLTAAKAQSMRQLGCFLEHASELGAGREHRRRFG